jgi:lipopolysaccharide biosynthesis regulator YciM
MAERNRFQAETNSLSFGLMPREKTMTFMSFLLLIILFLAFFIYFSGINHQDITIFYLPDHSFTHSVAIVVVGCILFGLVLGYVAHLYGTVSHLVKHWRRDREEKKAREVAAIYREGVGRLLSGDIKKAHSLLQKALDRDPSRVEAHIAMANVQVQEGDPQEGVASLLKAKSVEPRSLEVLFKLASTYEEMKLDEEAAKTFQDILNADGSNRKAMRSLRDLHMRHDRWKEALDLQKKIIKASSGTPRQQEEKQKVLFLRYEVARQALAAGQTDQAKAEFKEIIKESPTFVPARVSLGDAYWSQGSHEDAARVWQEGYRSLGKSIFLSRLEDLYMEAEDPATLLSFYRSAVMEKDSDLILRLFFGKLCLRLEMVDEALEQLHAIENAGVESPELHFLLAEAHRRRNRLDESIKEYQKALGENIRLRLGYVCDHCGEPTEEWESRCPECGTWGSFSLAGRGMIQNVPAPQVREIHHGERDKWQQA